MSISRLLSTATVGLLAALPARAAPVLTTLYSFTGGADGANPVAGLLPGPKGSFFGTTSSGGSGGGTIFQLSPPAAGQAGWVLTTLYSFTGGADGAFPEHLVADASGALYGMTNSGGIFDGICVNTENNTDIGCGTVFRLAPPMAGQTGWTLSTLYSFTGGADSSGPTGGVVFDKMGNLYGFTAGLYKCDVGQCGSAYELSPPAMGQTAWALTTLHSFTGGADGGYIGYFGLPVLDPSGKIFGIGGIGGRLKGPNCTLDGGCGVVFELTPPATGSSAWGEQTIFTFHSTAGITPTDGLTQDWAGNLYGTTNSGGDLKLCPGGGQYANGCGVAYRLSPPAAGATAWTETVLHRFHDGKDGAYPVSLPSFVAGGLYVTTTGDEVTTYGSINHLVPPAAVGKDWRNVTTYSFTNGTDGGAPEGPLVQVNGAIYGVTAGTGTGGAPNGTIFMLTP